MNYRMKICIDDLSSDFTKEYNESTLVLNKINLLASKVPEIINIAKNDISTLLDQLEADFTEFINR